MSLRVYQQPHYVTLLDALRRNGAALDASDMGTGKTPVAIAIAKALGVTPLVLCPKSVRADWERMGNLFGVEVDAIGYEKARGACRYETEPPRNPDDEPRRVRRSGSDYGFEKTCPKGSRWQWKHDFEFAIFDEVDRCGGMTSLHSKMLIAARRQFRHVLCLSATAADNPVSMRALGFTLGLFDLRDFKWWLFKHKVAPGVHGGFEFTDHPDEAREVMSKLHGDIFPSRGSRMRKAEIPGFPKTQIDVRLLDDERGRAAKLAGEIRDLYLLRNRQAAAAEERPAEAIMRKRQALELLKVPDLVELAKHYSQRHPVVLFVNFRQTAVELRSLLDLAPIIWGSNSESERDEIRRRFQANEIPILIVISEAGGIGLSLQDPTGQVERTALISPGWRTRIFRQVLGRLPRDGGAFSQQFIIYFAEGVEADIAGRVRANLERIDLLNDNILNGAFAP